MEIIEKWPAASLLRWREDIASNVSTTNNRFVTWRSTSAISVFFLGLALVHGQDTSSSYLGFDRNDYPGDANLKTLHQTFSYTGYWLNNPPGATSNSWAGHRAAVESAGFGFLVLFNGRLYAQLKTVANAKRLGQSDARAAAVAAEREGFPRVSIIFLDQEQGGRMLPEQNAYIYAWVDGITAAGFRAGMLVSAATPKSGAERSPLRRSLAVRSVAAAQGRRRTLHQLQPRRQLLSSGNECGAGTSYRRELGYVG